MHAQPDAAGPSRSFYLRYYRTDEADFRAPVHPGGGSRRWGEPWTELPIWLPPGELHDLLHRDDVSKALAAGLRCRPVAETIADTWAWLSSLDREPPQRSDRPAPGLSAEAEARLLGL